MLPKKRKGIGHEDAPSADDAPSKVTKSSSVLMDDVTATHDGKTGRVHYYFKFTSKCACNNNIIKVSASYKSLIDTDDPAKEMMTKSIVLINNHRTKKRNPDDSLVCNLDLTDFASFLRTDFAWRGLWADVRVNGMAWKSG